MARHPLAAEGLVWTTGFNRAPIAAPAALCTIKPQPDAEQRFMEVKAAFAVLSDAQQRANYDRRQAGGGVS